MKKFLLAALCGLSFLTTAQAQSKVSCCSKPSTEAFAAFASNQAFQSNHDNPLPYTLEDPSGEMVNFATTDGTDGSAYVVKSKKPSTKYLIVIHEFWGLNDYMKKKADDFAKAMPNVNILAVDLYDGKVATTKEDASTYMSEVSTERAQAILKGAMAYAGKKAEFQTIGWCFGGGWSLQTAIMAGKSAKGCVMYYGMPETDVKKLKTLKCDVLGLFAKKDQWITPKVVADFQKNMKEAGKMVTVKTFDADHAFANPSNPDYNNKFAAAADKMALDYLKKRFADKK